MKTRTIIAFAAGSVVLIAAAAAALLLATHTTGGTEDSAAPSSGPYRGSEPPGINKLPTFALPQYDGRGLIRSADLHGHVAVATFVDSACRQSCPIIIGVLGRALRQLSRTEHRQVIAFAISVDPRVDTPAHVRRFLTQRRALGELNYLVAPVAQMKPIWKQFHVLSAAETGNADLHSADVRVFDRNGLWVSTLNAGADLSIPNVVHDIRQAMRGRKLRG